jgi:dihydropyrimidinase
VVWDSHCHIEEPSRGGYASTGQAEPPLTVNEESFATASTAAFAGGTTSVVCSIPQWKGYGVWERYTDYRARAARGMIDHSFHQIISDPTDTVMDQEVPRLVAEGCAASRSFSLMNPCI